MRDLRIIALEDAILDGRTNSRTDDFLALLDGENITPATRYRKSINRRAALLAGTHGGASNPEHVSRCKASILAWERAHA